MERLRLRWPRSSLRGIRGQALPTLICPASSRALIALVELPDRQRSGPPVRCLSWGSVFLFQGEATGNTLIAGARRAEGERRGNNNGSCGIPHQSLGLTKGRRGGPSCVQEDRPPGGRRKRRRNVEAHALQGVALLDRSGLHALKDLLLLRVELGLREHTRVEQPFQLRQLLHAVVCRWRRRRRVGRRLLLSHGLLGRAWSACPAADLAPALLAV